MILKSKSVTIRAAVITGLFTIVAVIITFLLSITPQILNSLKKSTSPDEQAKQIVFSYFNNKKIEINKLEFCDLFGDGQKKEFYVVFSNAYTDNVAVFTLRNNTYENIFYRKNKGGESLDGYHITNNKKTIFIFTSNIGSGNFLDVNIYEYDGIGKLRLVHNEREIFGGQVYIANNRIYITGNNHRYELKRIDKDFKLIRYKERITHENGSGTHVLSYASKNKKLLIMFDGKPIEFNASKENDYQESKSQITINDDEQIIIDDNIFDQPPQRIRLLTEGEVFSYSHGFFYTLKPKSKGKAYLHISHNYDIWYDIDVIVK